MSLERFIEAQARDYAIALSELRKGEKLSCWIWYVFPQGQFHGTSDTSKFYAIRDDAEAMAYLCDRILGPRYAESVEVVHEQILKNGLQPEKLMGADVDAKKLCSSLTLMLRVMNSDAMKEAAKDCPWLAKLRLQAEALILRLPNF